MHILKRIALVILSPLFVALLFITAFDVGFINTATHPTTIKRLVKDSGIYNSVVPNILQQTKTIQTNLGSFSTSDPLIQKAANQAITPQYVQQNTEAAIDNIYAWLDGKIPQPNFKIDLSGAKANFANQVASSIQQQLSALPACSLNQTLSIAQAGSFQVDNATCLPRGFSPQTVAAEVKTAVLNNTDFLSNTSVSAADIKNGHSQQSVFTNQLKNAPQQYQDAKKTPGFLIFLTILVGVGIVFLSRTRLAGLRHLGISLLIVGLLMLLFSWGLNQAVNTQIAPKVKLDNALLQQDMRNLITDVTQQIDKNYWFFGGLYSLLGAGAIIGTEFYRRRNREVVSVENKDAPKVGSTTQTESSKTPNSDGRR